MFRRPTALAAASAALALVLAGCSSSAQQSGQRSDLSDKPAAATYQGFGLTPAQPRPSFTLTDTAGKPFSFSETSGHPTLLFFGYTRCDDDCPATMADISIALRHVPKSVAHETDMVFVTTDVRDDTGPVIAKWMSQYSHGTGARYIGLRGTQAQIDAAQAAAHVALATDGGHAHSTEVLLFGPDDYAHVAYVLGNREQQQMEHDLPIVAQTKS